MQIFMHNIYYQKKDMLSEKHPLFCPGPQKDLFGAFFHNAFHVDVRQIKLYIQYFIYIHVFIL